MKELHNLLGTKLYEKLLSKLDGRALYLGDDKSIPKYRFDEINKLLKEEKEKVSQLRDMLDIQRERYVEQMQNLKMETIMFKVIAMSNPKDFDTVLGLIKIQNLTLENVSQSVGKQIKKIKKELPSIFM